jgi:hypothetical protein
MPRSGYSSLRCAYQMKFCGNRSGNNAAIRRGLKSAGIQGWFTTLPMPSEQRIGCCSGLLD